MEALLCKVLVKEQHSRKAVGMNTSELISLDEKLRSALGMAHSTERAGLETIFQKSRFYPAAKDSTVITALHWAAERGHQAGVDVYG